jgi:hypothetical protein
VMWTSTGQRVKAPRGRGRGLSRVRNEGNNE